MPTAPVAPRSPVRTVPDFGGWEARSRPTGAEISAQGDAVRKAMLDGMTDMGKVLVESRDIQQKILDGIVVIAKNTGTPAAPTVPATTTAKPAANAPASPIPQRVQQAPVSMKRGF